MLGFDVIPASSAADLSIPLPIAFLVGKVKNGAGVGWV